MAIAPAGREIVPTERSSVRHSSEAAGLVFREALGQERERPDRNRAERVVSRVGRFGPVGPRGWGCARTVDDRELAFGADFVVRADRERGAKPVVLGAVVDRRAELDPPDAVDQPYDRGDRLGELEFELMDERAIL